MLVEVAVTTVVRLTEVSGLTPGMGSMVVRARPTLGVPQAVSVVASIAARIMFFFMFLFFNLVVSLQAVARVKLANICRKTSQKQEKYRKNNL